MSDIFLVSGKSFVVSVNSYKLYREYSWQYYTDILG